MRALLIALVGWLLSACGTLQIEEKNFIRPDSVTGATPAHRLDQAMLQVSQADIQVTELAIAGNAGAHLRGVLLRRPQAVATVLYFGGNAFHLDDSAKDLADRLQPCPVNLMVFDYRGYGRSDGAPTVATLQEDALALFDQASAQFPDGIFVHGHSLGSFVAAYVAQQRPVRGLVLEATANHALGWTQANVPWYVQPFVAVEVSPSLQAVDNTKVLAQFARPSLILAGSRDRVTPADLGRKVFDAMPGSSKEFVLVQGANHNDILSHTEAVTSYCSFLRRSTQLASGAQP